MRYGLNLLPPNPNSDSSFRFVPLNMRSNENLDLPDTRPSREQIASGAYLLRGIALDNVTALLAEIEQIETAAAF
ncbi:MAG: hypothetical protein QOD95_613, partial [Gammaproteobacteria bacterium]|nr:hypothetical protein [Gammaproteobacteria bacterium]